MVLLKRQKKMLWIREQSLHLAVLCCCFESCFSRPTLHRLVCPGRIPHLWEARGESVWLAGEDGCLWINYHAKHWRYSRQQTPSVFVRTDAERASGLSVSLCCRPAAMSSYLFIVKYELPEVIRAFLGLEENSGWVSVEITARHNFDSMWYSRLTWVLSLQWMVHEWKLPGGVCVHRRHSASVSP